MSEPFLEYSESRHQYYVDGVEYRSVTKILDDAGLITSFCKDEAARERGIAVHSMCEIYDRTGEVVESGHGEYLKAWQSFRGLAGFEPSLIEERVYDHVFMYAGRLDRYGIISGMATPAVVDIKTSVSGAAPAYVRYQLAAYAHALQPFHKFQGCRRLVVCLRPNGRFKMTEFPMTEYQQDLARFLEMARTIPGDQSPMTEDQQEDLARALETARTPEEKTDGHECN